MTRCLVFGASGYIGTHLVPYLCSRGASVRAVARRRSSLESRGWPTGVELVAADALDPASLSRALEGVDVAWYLVHSMAAGADFPRLDRDAAANFRDAAERAGVKRIVYLGGLQPAGDASAHLASRAETGAILREGSVPVTELRSGIVVGPGSAAFEIIRDLVFHLPVLVTPRWVRSHSQPIALANVLEYLARVPDLPEAAGATYEIGGPEVLTYEQLLRGFAARVGRAPVILPVPVLSPELSSQWLKLVTSVPADVARALVEGLAHDVLVRDASIRTLIPQRLLTYREALSAALEQEQALDATSESWRDGSLRYRGNRPEFAFYAKQSSGSTTTRAPVAAIWREVAAIGGENGYYFLDGLWRLRGQLDQWAGGAGMRRGRTHPRTLAVGDTIDFWRVASVESGRRLTLIAEMKLPGAAALEFLIEPIADDRNRLTVTAYFHPAGVAGLLYWNALLPAHALLFDGLARAIARRAEQAVTSIDGRVPGVESELPVSPIP